MNILHLYHSFPQRKTNETNHQNMCGVCTKFAAVNIGFKHLFLNYTLCKLIILLSQ